MPIKTTAEAIREATIQLLQESDQYYVMGEGVPDAKACFGTTKGLKELFPNRIWDMPVAENGMTGVAIGSALIGMRPIMVHMRADFLLYAADQIINNAAKWYRMFGGQRSVPLVIRAIVGRGWGQGIQHSQHLEELFHKIPGLIAVCPSDAYTAKGLLIAAARNNNPVIYFEHRWIHNFKCEVPDIPYEVNWNCPRTVKDGKDWTLKAWGYMVHECKRAAEYLEAEGVSVKVIDTVVPYAHEGTRELLIKEDSCCPPSPYLSGDFYPRAHNIASYIVNRLGKKVNLGQLESYMARKAHDVPNDDFVGPF